MMSSNCSEALQFSDLQFIDGTGGNGIAIGNTLDPRYRHWRIFSQHPRQNLSRTKRQSSLVPIRRGSQHQRQPQHQRPHQHPHTSPNSSTNVLDTRRLKLRQVYLQLQHRRRLLVTPEWQPSHQSQSGRSIGQLHQQSRKH